MADKRTLTIDKNYCEDWGIKEALREAIQNALDTHTDVDIQQSGNMYYICDKGEGMELRDFIMGITKKRGDETVIGQFGEGISIACLVFARLGRQVSIYSKGKRYFFAIEKDEMWQEELLTIYIEDWTNEPGTKVQIECSAKDMEEAKSLFLAFQPVPPKTQATIGYTDILDSPGNVFVNGLWVAKISSVYGYNFRHHKSLVNRDRNAINQSAINTAVSEVMGEIVDVGIITNLIGKALDRTYAGHAEFQSAFSIKDKDTWRSVIDMLYGKKVCMSYSVIVDARAMDKGYKVLDVPWGIARALSYIVKSAKDCVAPSMFKRKYVPASHLSNEMQDKWRRASTITKTLAEMIEYVMFPMKIYEPGEDDEVETQGLAIRNDADYPNGLVGINVRFLCRQNVTVEQIVGVQVHELVHLNKNGYDCTRAFENDLTDVIAKLAMVAMGMG